MAVSEVATCNYLCYKSKVEIEQFACYDSLIYKIVPANPLKPLNTLSVTMDLINYNYVF